MHRPNNLLPISIGLLALVVASAGTAVAATTTTTISDPTNSSYIAHVNSSGQLQVSGQVNVSAPGVPFLSTLYLGNFDASDVYQTIIGPTVATLGITQLTLVNSAINDFSVSEYLYQVPASSSKACPTDISSAARIVGILEAAPSVDDGVNLTSPYVLKPLASNQYYCVFAIGYPDTTSTPFSFDEPVTTIRGYVLAGAVPTSPDGATTRRP